MEGGVEGRDVLSVDMGEVGMEEDPLVGVIHFRGLSATLKEYSSIF